MLDECGEVGAFRAGPRDVVVVSSADHAKTILVDQAEAFEKGPVVRTFARPVLGDGLIPVANARHRGRRKVVAHGFGPRSLAAYGDVMSDVSERAIAGFGEVIDVVAETTRLTLRIVGRTLFSVDLGEEQPELSEAFAIVLRWVTSQISSPIPTPLFLNGPARRAVGRLDETIYALIDRRRRDGGGDDLLSRLVEARDDDGRPLPDRQIRDEAMNLFLAGHETSANALAWTVDLLLRNREVFDRLRDEPALADRVFEESLRLYPPVHSLGRQSTRAVELGPYLLPRSSIVIVSPLLMHRRASYFPDPDRFDPDRPRPFPKYAYLPFGTGPRACLGATFAAMEARIFLEKLARLDLSLVDDTPNEPEMLVTLRPRRPILARVRRR